MTQLSTWPPPEGAATRPTAPPAAAGQRRRVPRRALLLAAGAATALVLAVAVSVSLGAVGLGAGEALRAVVAPDDGQGSAVVWSIRLPRIAVALLVGAALAGVGVVMQAVFRNPLADPGVTGVSSGAAVGAVAGITLGLSGSLEWGVPLAAFAGAVVVALLLQAVLSTNRGASAHTLILVGVSINAFAGALISVLVANAEDDALARGAVFWLAGDLELRTWTHAAIAAVPVLAGLLVLALQARALDALLLGQDVAATSGFDVHRTRLLLLLVASLVTGAAVAVSGVISFVGLVVPHAVRLVVGARHALLLPLSVLCGALFLLVADTVARNLSVSVVVQTGAVCAVVGAPVFGALLLTGRRA